MKFLIMGRSATGKDTLQALLEKNYGWTFVKSMTTRPKRSPDEDTHVFLSEEEADAIPMSEHVAWTKINGYRYFATRQQVYEADAYIIDPEGAYMLLKNMPEEWFRIIYLTAADEAIREEMAIRRSNDPEKELKTFRARAASEDAQFTLFEQKMKDGSLGFPNCDHIEQFSNTYKENDLTDMAIKMEFERRFDRNLRPVIRDLINSHLINADEDGNPIVLVGEKAQSIGVDVLIEYLENNDAMLGQMMHLWLQVSTTNIPDMLAARDAKEQEDEA